MHKLTTNIVLWGGAPNENAPKQRKLKKEAKISQNKKKRAKRKKNEKEKQRKPKTF